LSCQYLLPYFQVLKVIAKCTEEYHTDYRPMYDKLAQECKAEQIEMAKEMQSMDIKERENDEQ
jgi:hypothetical protein